MPNLREHRNYCHPDDFGRETILEFSVTSPARIGQEEIAQLLATSRRAVSGECRVAGTSRTPIGQGKIAQISAPSRGAASGEYRVSGTSRANRSRGNRPDFGTVERRGVRRT
jgi:hypothetical protein